VSSEVLQYARGVTVADRTESCRLAPPAQRFANSGYIKTLDGWRAIAIVSVIFYHSPPVRMSLLGKFQSIGDRGVQLFFAISGLLICSRLLEEQRIFGNISLRGFYARRLFRIQPAAIFYLFVIVLLTTLGIIHTSLMPTLSALLCFRNYYALAGWRSLPDDLYTAHFWSLGVEEHFYLLLPALLIIAKKRIIPTLAILSGVFLVWSPIARHIYGPQMPHWRTDVSLQNLLFPALLAVLLTKPEIRAWATKISSHNLLIAGTLIVIGLSQNLAKEAASNTTICLGLPLLIISTVLHPEGWLGRLLESRLFVFLGRISYSLYLWQQLFFVREPHSLPQSTPLNLLLVLACATASYYLIEKPTVALGHKLFPPATSGRTV
jgi:peptidoglycan/LPS O-acetylase OafA/YrhL